MSRWRQLSRMAVLAVLAAAAGPPAGAVGVFTTAGRGIRLDGTAFSVQGVCFSPTPIGMAGSLPPYGDYYTAGYRALAERDLENLRALGANLVRVYGWTPGADHSQFLDMCYNGGERPVYVLINRWINPDTDWSDPASMAALAAEWTTIAGEVADHPAVFGILLGNEVNAIHGNGDQPEFWQAMNTLAAAVKAGMPDKLVGIAITDRIDQVDRFDATVTAIDFWGLQVYRGLTFGLLFRDYALRSGKPMVITEFGCDAYDDAAGGAYPENGAFPADVVEGLVRQARANAAICAGVCVFAYRDEWWKASGSVSVQDTGGFPTGAFPDGALNEEWWGIFQAADNGTDPDILTPRALFFRLAAYWRQPEALACAFARDGAGVNLTASCDAALRDMRLRVEWSANGHTWSTLAEGDPMPALASADQNVLVSATLEADGSTLTIAAQDTDPARGPVSLYRVSVDSK